MGPSDTSVRNAALLVAIIIIFILLGWTTVRGRGPKLELLEQRYVNKKEGPLGSGPGVVFSLKFSDGTDRPLSDYVVRLFDGTREFPIKPLFAPGLNIYLCPVGFGRPALTPRIEVWRDGRRLVSKSVSALPTPQRVLPHFSTNRDYQIYKKTQLIAGEEPQIQFTLIPTRPFPPQQAVDVSLLRTSFSKEPATASNSRSFGSSGEGRMATTILYGEDVSDVELRISRSRRVTQTEKTVVRGIRLRKLNGETVAVIDKPQILANHLGLKLVLQPQGRGPAHLSRKDRLSVQLDEPHLETIGATPPPLLSYLLLGPVPEKIGLRLVSFGSSTLRALTPPNVRPPATFDATIEINVTHTVQLGQQVVDVPVETGTMPKEPPSKSTSLGPMESRPKLAKAISAGPRI